MILPKRIQNTAAVARHYDELDRFYREVWGEHVHHGYWTTGRETPTEAAEALVAHLATRLDLAPGQHLGDIGCGYGAPARFLAQRFGVRVTGLTISPVQAALAQAALVYSAVGQVEVRLQDWLRNDFPDACFDRLYAIESSEHMPDKDRFFAEAFRTLKPGGLLAINAWLAGDRPRRWEIRHLLEPICREGRLPGMGDEADYRAMATSTGFDVVAVEDLTRSVRRTWSICVRRVLRGLVTDPRYGRFLLDTGAQNRVFALTMLRIMLAYRTGAMRYALLLFRRPA
ncbi:MAG: class I SAM-dependent methyltransferase [Acetobacteraceae bacterium]|nr:class I SAM-dependent methyltransferase [Pseudomonadota bacterium]